MWKEEKVNLPCCSGPYMEAVRGIPQNTRLPHERDLNMQIYLFMQCIGVYLDETCRYVPILNGMSKRQLFDKFNEYGKGNGKVKYDTFSTRLQELDTKWGLVIRKHGDIGEYKDIDYYYVSTNGFNIYNMIPKKTAEYLVGNGNDFIVKTYAQLYAWYERSIYKGENWTFTCKSLLEGLGYSSTPSQNNKVKEALSFLSGVGVLKYETGGRVFINNKSAAVMELCSVGGNLSIGNFE